MLSIDDYSGRIKSTAQTAIATAILYGYGDEIKKLKFVTEIGILYEDSLRTNDEEKLKEICEKMDKIQNDFMS